MKRVGVALVAVVACLAGCTQDSADLPPPPSTTAPAKKVTFPIRVQQSLGHPGTNEQVYIQDDGGVLANGQSGQVTCTLDEATLAAITDAAARIANSSSKPSAPAVASPGDPVVFMADARSDLVTIDDPLVGAARQAVLLLLDDVTGPAARRIVCH